jgi:hypothetical protein
MLRVLAAFIVYAGLALALFGRDVVAAPAHRVIGDGGADKTLYMWTFVWWPHALGQLRDPLAVDSAWAPVGFDFGWTSGNAGLAVVATPLTASVGPVVTYNALIVLALAVSASAAFMLARRLTRAFLPALLAGYLYGFSSYQLGHVVGHLPLVFVAALPAALHLALRRFEGGLGRCAFVLGLAGLLIAQFLLATEVLFDAALLGAVLGPLGWLVLGRDRRVVRVALESVAALAVCVVCVSPFLLHAVLNGAAYVPERSAFAESVDVANVVVPTRLTWLRLPGADDVSSRFTGTTAELGGYLGLPVLAIALLAAAGRTRPRAPRMLGLALALSFALSLGPRVKIAGEVVAPGLWSVIAPLPVAGSALPARLSLFTSLAAALLVALWLAERRSSGRWMLALIGAVALAPNLGLGLWSANVPRSTFFQQRRYERFLERDDIALVLPYGPAGWSMLWHAESGMAFRLVGGHFGIHVTPREREWADVYEGLGTGHMTPARLRAFLAAHVVTCVVVAPGTRPRAERVVAAAVDHPPVRTADAHVYVVEP